MGGPRGPVDAVPDLVIDVQVKFTELFSTICHQIGQFFY